MRQPAVLDLSGIPAVDGHCHPLVAESEEVSRERFLDLFSEGRAGTMRAHVAQTGYLKRALRGLADGLGCAPTVEAVLERRRAGGPEAARRRFAGSRITALLVDTGYPAVGAMPLAEMRHALPCAVHEVFRIETCAQGLVAHGLPYEEFLGAFRAALSAAASQAVALKSIIAYRSGLAVRAWEAADAARAYRRRRRAGQGGRIGAAHREAAARHAVRDRARRLPGVGPPAPGALGLRRSGRGPPAGQSALAAAHPRG